MILRSLQVEGFRCFDRSIALEDFSAGFNVIYGPNGAGKSTLFRALRHLLLDSHSLTGAGVRQAMEPWGRALSPAMRAVVVDNGTEWKVEKRFLSSPFTRLERRENGVFRPVAEGKEAERRLREMLLADAAESVVNVAAAVAALAAVRYAAIPPDANHPYGHTKAEYFSAVLEGALIVLAAIFILHEAWGAVLAPHVPNQPATGLLVSAVATAINGAWAAVLFRRGRAAKSPGPSARTARSSKPRSTSSSKPTAGTRSRRG